MILDFDFSFFLKLTFYKNQIVKNIQNLTVPNAITKQSSTEPRQGGQVPTFNQPNNHHHQQPPSSLSLSLYYTQL